MTTDALAAWKAKACTEVTLSSGVTVGLRLPNIRDCIISGDIPLSVVDKMQKVATASPKKGAPKAPDLTTEDLQHDARFQSEMVARAVVSIEGQPVTLTVADVGDLPEVDRDEIWRYAARVLPLPLVS